MADSDDGWQHARHDHVFLGRDHERAERRTWAVIVLCSLMMAAEIAGGLLFGSLALIADGLHMSTHAGALLLAALAYTYARKYAHDRRFTFGTGKFGDLAGYTSAIALAMISLLIGYEAVERLLHPVAIQFNEAIPIAVLGLAVNIVSAWLLSGGHHHGHDHGHDHGHGHGHHHGHAHHDHDHAHHGPDEQGAHQLGFGDRRLEVAVFEDGVPPRFRVSAASGPLPAPSEFSIETIRADGKRQLFAFADHGDILESCDVIPEPHAFVARVSLAGAGAQDIRFAEHAHDRDAAHHRDNNMRAAIVHVMADAAVSVLVIAGLVLARSFGWLWMDPVAGLVGAVVIANWSVALIRDTGGILLDRMPDHHIADRVRASVESEGDRVTDLHLWRLGPGHLGAIVCVATDTSRDAAHYRKRLARFADLSHVTVEVQHGLQHGPAGGR